MNNHFVCEVASAAYFGMLFDGKLGDKDNAPDGVAFSRFWKTQTGVGS